MTDAERAFARSFADKAFAARKKQLNIKRASIAAPGQLVGIILKKLGYKETPSCGCRAFSAKMNGWGWKGCFRREPKGHRDEIVTWFAARAAESGEVIDSADLWGLMKTAVRNVLRRKG